MWLNQRFSLNVCLSLSRLASSSRTRRFGIQISRSAPDPTKPTTTLDFNYVYILCSIDTSTILKNKFLISAGILKLLIARYLQSSTSSHVLSDTRATSYIPSARLSPRRDEGATLGRLQITCNTKSRSTNSMSIPNRANHIEAGRVRLLTRRFACPWDGHFVRLGLCALGGCGEECTAHS